MSTLHSNPKGSQPGHFGFYSLYSSDAWGGSTFAFLSPFSPHICSLSPHFYAPVPQSPFAPTLNPSCHHDPSNISVPKPPLTHCASSVTKRGVSKALGAPAGASLLARCLVVSVRPHLENSRLGELARGPRDPPSIRLAPPTCGKTTRGGGRRRNTPPVCQRQLRKSR